MNSAENTPNTTKEAKRARRMQHYAAASSLGYNMLGAAVWDQPGTVPKLVAAGLVAKGAGDYVKAYDMDPIVAREPRQRLRARFDQFMETWKENEGTSLRDRLKRNVGGEMLSFKDKEYRMRFNRVMGGLAMAAAGTEIMLSATSTREMVAGAVVGSIGVAEHGYNVVETSARAYELQSEELDAAEHAPPINPEQV